MHIVRISHTRLQRRLAKKRGLKNHLKFKHPVENEALFEGDEAGLTHTPIKVPAPSLPGSTGPARKKPRTAYSEITARMDADKRSVEEHYMKMWALTRDQIRNTRKDLKEEEDEELVRELEGDLKTLVKKKAEYAEMLGFTALEPMNTTEV